MNKLISVILSMLFLVQITAVGFVASEPPQTGYSQYSCLYNLENDEILYENNIDQQLSPASTVKIMTAILALEYFGDDMSRQITVTDAMLNDVVGTMIGFSAGEQLTAEDICASIIVGNASDACYIAAYTVAGSAEAFVEMMNSRAAELGMNSTRYVNPTGIDADGAYTSVRDVLTLTKCAAENIKFLEFSDMPRYDIDANNISSLTYIYNRNFLISTYYNENYLFPEACGLNAGYTELGGHCLSAVAKTTDGLTYIFVIMNVADTDEEFVVNTYADAKLLLDWAFNGFGYVTLLDTSKTVCEIPVELSAKLDHVTLTPKTEISRFLPLDVDVDRDVKLEIDLQKETLTAPVSEGDSVGTVVVRLNGEIVGESDLITKNNVDRSSWMYLIARAENIIESPLSIAIIALIIIIAVSYVLFMANHKKKKSSKVRYKKR